MQGKTSLEEKPVQGDRLIVEISYGSAGGDGFEWQLNRPQEFSSLAGDGGGKKVLLTGLNGVLESSGMLFLHCTVCNRRQERGLMGKQDKQKI